MGSDAGDMDLGIEVTKGVAAKFAQAVLGFAGVVVFARVLGPVGFGGFYLILSIIQAVDWPTSGFATATKKRFSEVEASKSEIIGFLLLFNLAFTAVAGAAALLLWDRFVVYTGVEAAPLLFVLMFFSMVSFYPFQRLLVAEGWVALSTWNDTFRSVATLGLQLALVLAGFEVAGMAVGWALATLMAVPVIHHYLRVRPAVPTRETVRSIWEFARYSIPTAVLGKAYSRYDVLLLGLLLTPAAVGYYEAAFRLTVPATFISSVAGSGMMAKVSNLESRDEEVAEDITNTIAFASTLAIPIFFGALALAEPLVVTFYGGDYRAAAPLLVGLALYQVFNTQGKTLWNAISGLDRPRLNMKLSGATLAVNVVLGYVLVLRVGAVGVVIATVFAEALRYVATAVILRPVVPDVEFLPGLVRAQVLAGIVMFVVVSLSRFVAPGGIHGWVVLMPLIGVGAAIYFVALWALSGMFRTTARSVMADMNLPVVGR